jgi:hypothetical protein
MPAFAPVDRSELRVFDEDEDEDGATLVMEDPVVEDEEELERVSPVWLASARRGADFGTNLSKSEDCHATEIGLAKATVTDDLLAAVSSGVAYKTIARLC